jgi:protein TonB
MKLAVLIAVAGLLHSQEILRSSSPKVLRKVNPEYSKEALDAKREGTVVLSAMTGVDGIPSEIKVVRGIGKGLDEKAVECLRQWRFSPALKDGEPTPVKVTIEIDFRLPSGSK